MGLLKTFQEESTKELEEDGYSVISPIVENLESNEMKRKLDSSAKSDVKKACLDKEPEPILNSPPPPESAIIEDINPAPESSDSVHDEPPQSSSISENDDQLLLDSDRKVLQTSLDVREQESQSTSTSRNERTNHQDVISRENKQTKAKLLRSQWKILELEGHEDIVTDCDIDEK